MEYRCCPLCRRSRFGECSYRSLFDMDSRPYESELFSRLSVEEECPFFQSRGWWDGDDIDCGGAGTRQDKAEEAPGNDLGMRIAASFRSAFRGIAEKLIEDVRRWRTAMRSLCTFLRGLVSRPDRK